MNATLGMHSKVVPLFADDPAGGQPCDVACCNDGTYERSGFDEDTSPSLTPYDVRPSGTINTIIFAMSATLAIAGIGLFAYAVAGIFGGQ
jgi:hypothetical protein